jgi:hypothetical protein
VATDHPNRTEFLIAVRQLAPGEADRVRAEIVRKLLCEMICAFKANLGPEAWLNGGWHELADFVDQLCNGRPHPALEEWAEAKRSGGHPVISARERQVRRYAVLLAEALRRIGLPKGRALRAAADALTRTHAFDRDVSASTIRHWRQRDCATLFPEDEQIIATGIATAGLNPSRLAIYFVGLCHLAHNPSAVVVRDGRLPTSPRLSGQNLTCSN